MVVGTGGKADHIEAQVAVAEKIRRIQCDYLIGIVRKHARKQHGQMAAQAVAGNIYLLIYPDQPKAGVGIECILKQDKSC